MNDSLTIDELAAAAEYLQARRHMQFYIGFACLVVAVLLPLFLLFPLAADGSVAWRTIAAIVTMTIWSLIWAVYAKANFVTGFLVAGFYSLAAGCAFLTILAIDHTQNAGGIAFATAVAVGLPSLRTARFSWQVFKLSRRARAVQAG